MEDYFAYQQTRPHQLRGRIMADMIHQRIEATGWDKLTSNTVYGSSPPVYVVEVGIGNGWLTRQYAGNKYQNAKVAIVGVDPHAAIIGELCRFVLDLKANLTDLQNDPHPFKSHSFDGFVLGEVLEHVDTPAMMLTEVYDLLAPGGWVVGSVPNSGQLWDVLKMVVGHAPHQVEAKAREPHYEHQSFFTAGLLRSLLHEVGFTRVKITTNLVRLLPRGRETQIPLLSPFVERFLPRFGDRLIWECEK